AALLPHRLHGDGRETGMNTTEPARAEDVLGRLREALRGMLPAEANGRRAEVEDLLAEVRNLLEELRARQPQQQLEQAFAEVLAQRLHYQELFESAPCGYLVTDRQGVIREANLAAAALLGRRKEFVLGLPLPAFTAPEDRWGVYDRLTLLNRKGESGGDWEVRLQPPRGPGSTVLMTVTAITDQDERPVGWRWVLRDITRRKQAERCLDAERLFVDSLVNTAQAVVLVLDDLGRVLRANPFLTSLAGHEPSEVLGQDWARLLIAAEDRPAARTLVVQTLKAGESPGGVYTLVTRAGLQRTVAWRGKALTRPDGETAALVVGYDITELQEAQQHALRAERLAAIGATVAGLAHESRNALQRAQACLVRLSWQLEDRP